MGKRDRVLAELAGAILAVERAHPVRVALDGCSAAGKTTMADELADVLRDRTDRDILRIGIDAFTRPAELRTAYPYDSPESYYLDTWDLEAIRDQVLVPLGPGGDRHYALEPSGARHPAAPDAVLLADGIFLQRPELITHWDLRIYVHISFDEVLRRGIVRDQYRMTR